MNIYQKSVFKSRKKLKINTSLKIYILKETMFLVRRLIIQAIRRPANIISGVIQPILWLILFGGSFENLPLNLFNVNDGYGPFLSCGIIIFTSFTASLNAGIPLIFDREFGFLNRLLVAPLASRNTIIYSATLFIICITMIQNLTVIVFSLIFFQFSLNTYQFCFIFLITLLITCSVSSLSLGLAFIFPGHIEFLAFIFIINLPILFASTALSPLCFMPYWLQLITKLNPLTYAIESIRFVVTTNSQNINEHILYAYGINVSILNIICLLLLITLINFTIIKNMVTNKLE